MLRVLSGDHTLLRQQALASIRAESEDWRVIDAEQITEGDLEDLLLARSLFSQQQNLIFYHLTNNQAVLARFIKMTPTIAKASDLQVVLVEDKLDRRSQFSKLIKQESWETEFKLPSPYDQAAATRFMIDQAKRLGRQLTPILARQIFDLVGPNPWDQFQAITKLAVFPKWDSELFERYLPKQELGNVFVILDLVLQGRLAELEYQLNLLKSEALDVHRFWGLLISQLLNLIAFKCAPSNRALATELGIHPYAAQKMATLSKQLGLGQLRQVLDLMLVADRELKNSSANTWQVVWSCLFRAAQLKTPA